MSRTDVFDLERLQLRSGEGRRLDLEVALPDFRFAAQPYEVVPKAVPVRLDVSRMTGDGYSLRLRLSASLHGPCMRCLDPASPVYEVDAREVNQPGGGDEMTSPYVDEDGELDLAAWSRDALVLAVPDQVVCRPDCAGLCPECGENLNENPGHAHEKGPDPRWAVLRDLKLE